MIGPFTKGHWTATGLDRRFRNLVAGCRYVVVAEFADYDGDIHPEGENWTFLGANFLPHEDGQSLFVSCDDKREWHIRLCWLDEEQANVLDHFARYVKAQEVC